VGINNITFQPCNGASAEKRPDFEAFAYRSFTFATLLLFEEAILWGNQPFAKWLAHLAIRYILVAVIGYNFYYWTGFRRLAYQLTESSLVIRWVSRLEIPYSTISRVVFSGSGEDDPLQLERKSVWSYSVEVPSLVNFVGQRGKFGSKNGKEVLLYSTVSSLRPAKGLIIIETSAGRSYGISPDQLDAFMAVLQDRLT